MAGKNKISDDFIRKQVRVYKKVRPTYGLMKRLVDHILSEGTSDLNIL